MRTSGIHLAIGLASLSALPAQEVAPKPKASAPYTIDGFVDFKYIGRWTDGARDHDAFGYTTIDFGSAREHLLTGRFSGRAAWDLDRNREPTHPFRSTDDSFSGDVTGRIYSAYVDVNATKDNPWRDVVKRARIGRQVLYGTPRTLYLDGVAVESQPVRQWMDLDFQLYGGAPSHLFELSRDGDYATGGVLRLAPWAGARVRVDYMHVTDEYLSSSVNDDLAGIRLDQRIGQEVFASLHANAFDFEDVSNTGAFVNWNRTESDFSVTLRYSGLGGDEKRRSIDLDYYTEVLARYVAFDQYELTLHKGLGESLYLEGGAQFRELRHDSKDSLFNHEFRRYHGLVGASEWPWRGANVSGTYEFWDAGGDRFTSFGADITHKQGDRWSGSLGTFFDLFRYNALRGNENEDVQVSYLKLTYHVAKERRLRVRVEFEDGERDDYYTLDVSMQIDF